MCIFGEKLRVGEPVVTGLPTLNFYPKCRHTSYTTASWLLNDAVFLYNRIIVSNMAYIGNPEPMYLPNSRPIIRDVLQIVDPAFQFKPLNLDHILSRDPMGVWGQQYPDGEVHRIDVD